MQTLLEIIENYRQRGIQVFFAKLAPELVNLFMVSGITQLVGEDHFVKKISTALDMCKVTENPAEAAGV